MVFSIVYSLYIIFFVDCLYEGVLTDSEKEGIELYYKGNSGQIKSARITGHSELPK